MTMMNMDEAHTREREREGKNRQVEIIRRKSQKCIRGSRAIYGLTYNIDGTRNKYSRHCRTAFQ